MAMTQPTNDTRALVSIESQGPTNLIPAKSEWGQMHEMATALVKTGFLPKAVDTPEKALAIMLKGRELQIPPMQALANIAVINGKPTVQAELMLALIYRAYGKRAIRVKESNDTACTVEYRLDGWDDVQSYSFTMDQAKKAGLVKAGPWQSYPAAMLRARCISAVARMAFPECIAGMYVPGELGDDVTVTDDGEVVSVTGPLATVTSESLQLHEPIGIDTDTGEIHDVPQERPAPRTASERTPQAAGVANDSDDPEAAEPSKMTAMKRLHAVGKDHGIDHDVLHAMAERGWKVESLRDLDAGQLGRLADRIEGDPQAAQTFARAVKTQQDQAELSDEDAIEAALANSTPTNGEPEPVSDADYMAGADVAQRPANYLEPTERQRKLIDVLRSQLNLSAEELDAIAVEHGGAPMATIDRRGVSALLTELQRIKQEKRDRERIS